MDTARKSAPTGAGLPLARRQALPTPKEIPVDQIRFQSWGAVSFVGGSIYSSAIRHRLSACPSRFVEIG